MAKSRRSWLRYWPAALFIVCNAGVIVLTRKALQIHENSEALQASYEADTRWSEDATDLASPDAVAPDAGEDHTPLLLDWGSKFDPDLLADHRRNNPVDLVARVNRELDRIRAQARRAVRRKEREKLEERLLRSPLRFNFYSNRGSYLGQRAYLPPPDFTLPPISPVMPLQFATGAYRAQLLPAGEGQFNVVVDPELFRDEQAMRKFITSLTRDLVTAGLQPQIRVGRVPDNLAPQPGAAKREPGGGPLPPLEVRPGGIVPSIDTPLPKPPPDVIAATEPPRFEPDLSGAMFGPTPPPATDRVAAVPTDIRAGSGGPPAESRPATPGLPGASAGPAITVPSAEPRAPVATPSPGTPENGPAELELPGSDTTAEAAAPRQPAASTPREPRVALRIRLAATPDKKAAEARLRKLRAAGLGGTMYATQDGLGYWVVQSKVLTRRSEAEKGLATVRGMGYEAWLN